MSSRRFLVSFANKVARLFDPSGRGRPMKEWVKVPGEHASRWLELAQAALRYVNEAH